MGFVVGLALGIWVALYHGHLRAYRPARALLFVLDLLFWLGTLVLVAVGLYFTDWLSLRLYALFAIGVGLLTSLYLAGPFFGFLGLGGTRMMLLVLRALILPVRWVRRRLWPRGPGRGRGSGSGPAAGGDAGGDGGGSSAVVPGPGSKRRVRPWWIPDA